MASRTANTAFFLAAFLGVSSVANATETTVKTEATEPLNCAARYHARLVSESADLAKQTQASADKMRKPPTTQMPGHWLFWDGTGVLARNAYQQRLLATPLMNREANVMCARQILARGGRIRCMKWKPIPPDYKPSPPKLKVDPSKPTISPAERQFAASLAPLVSRSGGFSQLARGTAFYHLLQRTTDELTGYTTQPSRSTICTGGLEMVDFYRRQLRPLSEKTKQSLALKKATLAAATATTSVILGRSDEVKLATDLGVILPALLKLSISEPEAPDAQQPAPATPFAALQQARDHLSDDWISAMPAERSARLQKAWRNVEFAIYAEYQHAHIKQLNESFERALKSIVEAHQAECTCGS